MVEDVERYIAKCSNKGIESAISTAITIAKGDGPITEDNQLCGWVQDMFSAGLFACDEGD